MTAFFLLCPGLGLSPQKLFNNNKEKESLVSLQCRPLQTIVGMAPWRPFIMRIRPYRQVNYLVWIKGLIDIIKIIIWRILGFKPGIQDQTT